MTTIQIYEIWEIKERVQEVEEAFQGEFSDHELYRRGNSLIELLEETEIKETKYSEFKEYINNINEYSEYEGQQTFVRFLDRFETLIQTAPEIKLNYDGEFNAEVFKDPLNKFNDLNLIAEEDIKVGAKCMLHGLYTTAGFMFLRSLEEMTRELLKKETNEEIEESWGRAMKKLSKSYEDMGLQTRREKNLDGLYSSLNELKNLRNDVAHPNKILNREEGEKIFFRVRSTSEKISKRLNSIENS